MIISASRRTDIPAFYSEWFLNRIKEQFVMVRNPVNHKQISKINLSPQVIDAIVFWTKNPFPMLDKLNMLESYMYYFQYTLNTYDKDVEPCIPEFFKRIQSFQTLSDRLGSDRVIWRYDPIFFSEKYTMKYHICSFEKIAKLLSGYTDRCTISFLDFCNSVKREQLYLPTENEQIVLAEAFADIAKKYDIIISTCAEKLCFKEFGIQKASCIDQKLLEKLLGCTLNVSKDKGQRSECGCVSSIDIGVYNTCHNGCNYCYANYDKSKVMRSFNQHDSHSPLLIGNIDDMDKVIEKEMYSLKDLQISLF